MGNDEDQEENYRVKGKNRSDHNTIMLTISKKLNQEKKNNTKYGK